MPVGSPSQTKTRMRVVTDLSEAPTNPCDTYEFGETEEFLVDIVCLSLPSAPTATGGSRCGTGTVSLSATGCGGTLNWYSASTGGTSLGTTNPFITPSISTTTTYYVDCTVSGCTSASRSSAIATVTTAPSAPTVAGVTILSGQTATLTATGCTGTVKWYATATSTVILQTATSYTSSTLTVNTTYYADCTVSSCTSTTRTSALVTILTCPSTLTLISTTDDIASGNITKQASSTVSVVPSANIMATNKISGVGTRATYQAKSILLNPGFKVDSGVIFKVEIGGCN